MRYISTRGEAPALNFTETALAGGRMFNRNGDLVCTVEQETYFPPPRGR